MGLEFVLGFGLAVDAEVKFFDACDLLVELLVCGTLNIDVVGSKPINLGVFLGKIMGRTAVWRILGNQV